MEDQNKDKQKKGFWAKLFESWDKKMAEQAKSSGCCCCSSTSSEKKDKTSCC